ncbi:uncharacterized protein [Prorops nasuta]|uniref:uncharacterized protein n=1 Tax=Prorops nasuta TaxID=863751 RepID=UPI0034CFE345
MIPECIISSSYLLFMSGFSIYSLQKYTYKKYTKFVPHLVIGSIGLVLVGVRSCVTIIYKVFINKYTINPLLIEEEEEKNGLRVNLIDEILRITCTTSIACSLFYHNGFYITGSFITLGICFFDVYQVMQRIVEQEENHNWMAECYCLLNDYISFEISEDIIKVLWFFALEFVAWWKNDNYCLLAGFPYILVNFVLPSEGFYQGWTLQRTINDYLMIIYVILVTESLCS